MDGASAPITAAAAAATAAASLYNAAKTGPYPGVPGAPLFKPGVAGAMPFQPSATRFAELLDASAPSSGNPAMRLSELMRLLGRG